jgi:hypothetical protein
MSEALLFDINAQLRLLARAEVRCASDGRRLGGVIDAQLEAMRLRLLDILEQVQDGLPLSPEEEAHIHVAQSVCRDNTLVIRSLRRQLERES